MSQAPDCTTDAPIHTTRRPPHRTVISRLPRLHRRFVLDAPAKALRYFKDEEKAKELGAIDLAPAHCTVRDHEVR